MYRIFSNADLKTNHYHYFGFIKTKDKRYIPAQAIWLRKKRYFFQSYINGCTVPELAILATTYCFELDDNVESFFAYCVIKENSRYYPFSYNKFVLSKTAMYLAFLYFTDTNEYKTCLGTKGKFYFNDKVISYDEVIKSGKVDLEKSYHSSITYGEHHHGNYIGSIYACDNVNAIVFDNNKGGAGGYNSYNLIEEKLEITYNPRSLGGSTGEMSYNLEMPYYEKQPNTISFIKNNFTACISSTARKGNGTLVTNTCCDFIKTIDDHFTYYLNIHDVYKYGNDEELIPKWIDFISDFVKSTFKIGEETDNTKLNIGSKKLTYRYLAINVNGKVSHSYENYINLILIRLLQNGSTAYLPNLAMDIYDTIHEETGISKWQALLIASHSIPYQDYYFGHSPNLKLVFKDFLSNTSSGSVNKYFTDTNLGIDIALFENRKYLEIYNKIKKYYDNL